MTSEMHAESQRRAIGVIEPGYFSMRLVRNGWRVPCRIIHDEHGWHAVIDGCEHPSHPDPYAATGVSQVWERGLRIDPPTYNWLIALKAYALAHEPQHPAANPLRAINPNELQPIIPRTPHS
jgi:hypothetical protein